MISLAGQYEDGDGIKQNLKKAKQLLATASDRGHATAQCNLGLMHRKEGNNKEALRNFKRSADQGYTDAMYMVGQCYLTCYQDGRRGDADGAEPDLEEAKRWLKLAAAKGNKYAIAVESSHAAWQAGLRPAPVDAPP